MPDFLSARRERVAQGLSLGEAVLIVAAGEPIPLPENSDQTYPFRSHSEYLYLAGEECAGGIVVFDPRETSEHRWISFVPEVTEAERVWEGRTQLAGTPRAQFDAWLSARAGRPVAVLGSPLPGLNANIEVSRSLREQLRHLRRPKDAHEIALIRRAAAATAPGYAKLRELLRPGVTERALQIELEAEFFRAGGTRPGYGTIVGTGPNSAILHFEPSHRAAQAGEFVLVDAGAEIDRYLADVTRTYVVGLPSPFQRDLYQVVLAAEQNALARCRPGAEWREIHLAAAVEMMGGLVAMGVMRGNPSSLVDQEAHTLFFPHGLGHMVGLGVRDGSGLEPGRTKDPRASLKNLRMDLPLRPGYVATVEPGLYFIPPLLNDPVRRERFRDAVNWPLVDQHLHLGGVRIEDNVLITDDAPEVLTAAIPKDLA
jgi:Xaa-Pro aminopeptidase